MKDGICDHPEAENLMLELAMQLEHVKGKKQYGYLPKKQKALVDKILTWADMFEGSTLEGKKMIMWQLIEKVRIYRDYQFEVDLKPTVKEFKALWNKRSTQSTNGAA